MEKNIKFLNYGKPLDFDAGGYAVNPFSTSPQPDNAWKAGDFRDLLVAVAGTGNVIVYGSSQETPPDFSAPSTIDNFYVAIVLADYSIQNTYYNGAVGVSVVGASKLVEVNSNLLNWVAIKRSVNTVDVKLTETNAL